MKKGTARLLTAALLLSGLFCLVLTSCGQKKADILRICFDIGTNDDMSAGTSFQQSAAKGFVSSVSTAAQLNGRELGDIEIEVIPSDGKQASEREAALQRIRTEIMTGSGPDVFICCTEGSELARLSSGRLFPYLSNSIEDEIFLPLDGYMEKFQLVSSDELAVPILEGGRDSEGRQAVMPICYSIPCMAWEKGAADAQSGILSEQVRWLWPIGSFPAEAMRMDSHTTGLSYIYPDLLNYKEKRISMSEEDLTVLIKSSIPTLKELMTSETENYSWALLISRMLRSGIFPTRESDPETTDITLVPLQNEAGGTTAVVSMFCAVNADTSRPEDAAFVVEYLLSQNCQNGCSIFDINNAFSAPSLLINRTAMRKGDTQLTPATVESLDSAHEQVNRVCFPSPADTELNNMLEAIKQKMRENYSPDAPKYDFIRGDISDKELEEIVHEYYEKISRLLEES